MIIHKNYQQTTEDEKQQLLSECNEHQNAFW
jgi:hypothetical protein